MKKLRIVFMGTPEFAVGILNSILQNNYDVVGVVTAADKPAGRGQQLKFSAVKQFALDNNLHLLQPTNLKDVDFIESLQALNANLHVIVAFRMLPKIVWDMPEYGTFNLHASLLPDYRGAAPINWAIINGETKTGVTTFFIDDKIDTGAMILSKEIAIEYQDNAEVLHDKLLQLGCETVLETLSLIENDGVKLTIQKESLNIKTANKLNKENCKIDWSKTGTEIYNQIRGLSPYPAAWTYVKDNEVEWAVKIFSAEFHLHEHEYVVGQIITTKKDITVAVANGFIKIQSLQFPGKKIVKANELLNGMKFSGSARVS